MSNNGPTTTFKAVDNYTDSLTTQQLETNIMSFLNWGFLNIGAFQNVYLDSSGVNGGNKSRLRAVQDPYLPNGTAFEGFRQDWVWETGIHYQTQPVAISGVWVDGSFIPKTSSGQYSHTINYPAGRVLFNSPVTGSPVIQCEHSFRQIKVDLAESPWFQQVQFNSYRIDDPGFLMEASGAWNILSQNRIQLPAVVIESVFNASRYPYELGSQAMIHNQDLLFNIIAETDYDRKQLHDILVGQEGIVIKSFDKDKLLASGLFPLTADGYLVDNPLNYEDIVNNPAFDFNSNITFHKMRSSEAESNPPLYLAKCRGTFECYLP